ncbi:phosphonate metabolism transcriptional regulator PhnF [Rhizobium halophytocola]
MAGANFMQRQNGVALWRQIADRIRTAIADGTYDQTGRLPAEARLASEFSVNRHTVRAALASLAQEGVVRAIQGRGTLIERRDRISFPISSRTRFTEGVAGQASNLEGLLLDAQEEAASPEVARALQVGEGSAVLRLETVRKADGRPLSAATGWFPLPRFAGLVDAYRRTGSITRAFALCGLADYLRARTEISATHAEDRDLQALGLTPGAIVLVSTAVNVDLDGTVVQYAVSRFPADRVQLTVTGG